MLNYQSLVKALCDIKAGEGFNVTFQDGCGELTLGIRCRNLIDTTCIFAGGYTMPILTYNLNENDDCEEIATDIFEKNSIKKLIKFTVNNE